jgi:hypothetical protein
MTNKPISVDIRLPKPGKNIFVHWVGKGYDKASSGVASGRLISENPVKWSIPALNFGGFNFKVTHWSYTKYVGKVKKSPEDNDGVQEVFIVEIKLSDNWDLYEMGEDVNKLRDMRDSLIKSGYKARLTSFVRGDVL